MQSVIMITIKGDMFLFDNNGLTEKDYNDLQNLADFQRENILHEYKDENDIYKQFIQEAKTNLNIVLEPVEISFVVRVK